MRWNDDLAEITKQTSTSVVKSKKSPEVAAEKQAPVIPKKQPIENEQQKRVASSKDTDIDRELKLPEKPSHITVPKTSVRKYEDDWFDKLLDVFAVIVGGISRIIGH